MIETQNFIETRDHQSTDKTPFDTVLFDLWENVSFVGTVTITALNLQTRLPVRKVIDVSGLSTGTGVLFDGEIAENLRAQIVLGDTDIKVTVWDNLDGRAIQWRIVGNIDQTREVDG